MVILIIIMIVTTNKVQTQKRNKAPKQRKNEKNL